MNGKSPYTGPERRQRQPYIGPERRGEAHISDEQIERIAEVAAAKAVEKMTNGVYAAVGKTVIARFIWIVGVMTVAVYLGLRKLGLI